MGMGKSMVRIMGSLILVAAWAAANASAQTPAPATGQQQTPPASQPDKSKDQVQPLTMTPAAPPVNAEEDAAIKAFRDIPNDSANLQKEAASGK